MNNQSFPRKLTKKQIMLGLLGILGLIIVIANWKAFFMVAIPIGVVWFIWKKTQLEKVRKWLYSIIVVLLALVVVYNVGGKPSQAPPPAKEALPTAEKEVPAGEKPGLPETAGIGMTRQTLISALEKPPFSFDIYEEKWTLPGCQPRYIGWWPLKTDNSAELCGPANNLTKVIFSADLSHDRERNLRALVLMLAFAELIDPNSVEWLNGEFDKAAGKVEYTNEQIFGQRRFHVSYKGLVVLDLTITPAEK